MSSNQLPSESVWLGHWILFGASCNIAGWMLSAIHQLHVAGLLVAIPCTWLSSALLIGLPRPQRPHSDFTKRLRTRFSRPFALSFLILGTLSLLAGLIYPPNNFDALIYRMPRVLDWLMHGGWEWIETNKNNLNTRSTGFEWWTAPVFAILRTDRLIFLINLVSFLFLPGITFNLFRRMGVSIRVARIWMWLLPSGYCFALQAASVGNDMLAAFFAVAAFDFAFRWKHGGGYPCFALSLLAGAMMTAIKPTTLPLLFPFCVLFFSMWRTAIRKPAASAALIVLFSLASFAPTAAINIRQCGDWTGAAAEDLKMGQVEPLIGIVGNTINATLQNVMPPVFPIAGAWNRMFASLVPDSLTKAMARNFESDNFNVSDFQNEEGAGAGMGITLLLVVSMIAAWLISRRKSPQSSERTIGTLILAMLFGTALLAYFSRAGMSTVGRHIAPFYPFFFAICLRGKGHDLLVRSRMWKSGAALAVCSSLVLVFITPSRPLWPAQTFFEFFGGSNPPKIVERARTGYSVYAGRSDALGVLRDVIPESETQIAYLSFGHSAELPLWKPYMRRRLIHIPSGCPATTLKSRGLRYVVVNSHQFASRMGATIEDWISPASGTILFKKEIRLLASAPPSDWYVIRLDAPTSESP